MKNLLLLISFCPLLALSQHSRELPKKNQPKNCIALSDSTFIGQTEITNRMYREFVQFVKDSMFTHLLYDSLPYDRAKYFLKAPEKTLKKLTDDQRPEYAKIYGLNYEYYKAFIDYDSLYVARAKSMYYPDADRFYHRREVDVRQLMYTLPAGETVPVFPDTLSWIKDYYVKYAPDTTQFRDSWASSLTNMYFWHPAYDNYPVVGLNQAQILAYCHWYARQLNENTKDPNLHYSVSLPTMDDYTAAMKLCVPAVVKRKIGQEYLVNPIIYERNEDQSATHIHKAYNDMDAFSKMTPDIFVMQEWVKTNATSPTCPPERRVCNLLGGPAEVVQNPKEPDYLTVLGGDYYLGIVDPNGIQANTLFYQRLLYKDQGYSFVGFRVLVRLTQL